GATGDLAHKKIYPALQALTRDGELDMPVIGVARAGWTVDQLREQVRQSLAQGAAGVDQAALARLAPNLRYTDGAYRAPSPAARCTTSPSRRRCSGPWCSRWAPRAAPPARGW